LILTNNNDGSLDKNLLTKSPVFSDNSSVSSNYIKSMKNSYKVSSLISKSKTLNFDSFNDPVFLGSSKLDYLVLRSFTGRTKNYYDSYSDFYLTDLVSGNQKNIDYTLNINEVNSIFKNNPDYQNLLVNLNENTNIAKQIR
jgi:hypothetical protein